MTTVYLVYAAKDRNLHVLGIWSTRTNAERFRQRRDVKRWTTFITEAEVDTPLGEPLPERRRAR